MGFKQIVMQLKTLFLGMSRGKQVTLAGLVLSTLLGLVLLMSWSGKTNYQTLYTQLDPNDAGRIIAKLKEQKVPYRIAGNGSAIEIPADQIHEMRMQMASEGLPQGGSIGFEVFDNTKIGMTEFAQNVNYQRALQGELQRTINRIAEVESSRVHIVMPEKTLFIDQEEPASASVVLKLRPGRWLSKAQINGIVYLVSSSVARLSPENVTLVDSSGKLLAGHQQPSAYGDLSLDQLDYQAKFEKNLEERIKTMLEAALGKDKAIVRLSCSFDFQRQETTEERFLPENQVIRSEQSLKESSTRAETAPQGVPGLRSNLPGAEPPPNAFSAEQHPSFAKDDRTVNYEIGKVTSHILEPVGEMTRVSVAVLVDGTYRKAAGEEGEGEWQYVPRSAEEMNKLENIVKRAVNYDLERGDKVELVNIPFESSKLSLAEGRGTADGWRVRFSEYWPYAKHVFLALFLILTFLFFIKPLVRWLTEQTAGDVELLKQLPKTVGELEREYGGDAPALAYRDQISKLIADDSEASTGVVRSWLNEPQSR
jgi:flagellar M-ring protein FliF